MRDAHSAELDHRVGALLCSRPRITSQARGFHRTLQRAQDDLAALGIEHPVDRDHAVQRRRHVQVTLLVTLSRGPPPSPSSASLTYATKERASSVHACRIHRVAVPTCRIGHPAACAARRLLPHACELSPSSNAAGSRGSRSRPRAKRTPLSGAARLRHPAGSAQPRGRRQRSIRLPGAAPVNADRSQALELQPLRSGGRTTSGSAPRPPSRLLVRARRGHRTCVRRYTTGTTTTPVYSASFQIVCCGSWSP